MEQNRSRDKMQRLKIYEVFIILAALSGREWRSNTASKKYRSSCEPLATIRPIGHA